jgi:hypothetical protein
VRGRESPVFQKLTDVYDISALPERVVKKRADVPLRFREIGSGIRQVTLEEYQYLISLRKLDDAFYCSEFDRMTRGRPAQFGRNRPKRFGAMRRDANDRCTPTLPRIHRMTF